MKDIDLTLKPSIESRKDAIHVAIIPLIAGENLSPGTYVSLNRETKQGVKSRAPDKNFSGPLGVVNPFYQGQIKKGEVFYLLLTPGTVMSIRHDWTHPEFKEMDEENQENVEGKNNLSRLSLKQQIAREFLEAYAISIGSDLDELLYRTRDYLLHDEYWNEGARFDGEYLPDGFWSYYEDYTNTKVEDGKRYSFFSCSC